MLPRAGSIKLVAIAATLALTAFVWNHGGTPRAQAVFYDSDGDGSIDITEVISSSDPQSAASTPEDIGLDLLFGGNSCSDGIDNDGDGLVDSADPGCVDSDHDFISNQMETTLGSDPNDNTSFPESSQFDALLSYYGLGFGFTCGDAVDNDHDGLTDAADPGCVQIQNDGDGFSDATEKLFGSDPNNPNSVPEHEIANPGSCSDGIDNDLDGLIDGADPGCQPAPNDNFSDAIAIQSLPYNNVEKINTATRAPTDPYPSCATGSMTVWYAYTATSDGVLVAGTAGSSFGTAVSVWTPLGGRLSQVACAGSYPLIGQSHVAFRAVAGQTYYVLIDGTIGPGQPASLNFHLDAGTPPPNDDFASAETISALPFAVTVDTSSATTERNEPSCYGDAESSVWYRFSPAQDTLVVADAGQSNFTAVVGVWTQGTFGLKPAACSIDYITGDTASRAAFVAQAGETYYIQASANIHVPSISSGSSLRLSVDVGISPANDARAGATQVTSLPFNDTVDTFTATSDIDDPLPSCLYGSSTTRSIWYRYEANADSYIEADLGTEAGYGTVIAVYDGSTPGELPELACAASAPLGKAGFAAKSGHTYYVFVASQTYRGKFSPVQPAGGPGSPPSTIVNFHMDTLAVPSCASPTFAFTDGTGDFFGGFGPPPPGQEPPDITSITGGDDGQNACIQVQFASAVPPAAEGSSPPVLRLNFDLQELPGRVLGCSSYPFDLAAFVPIPSNLVVSLYSNGPISENAPTGFALFDDRMVTIIVPLSALGGDNHYRFTASTSNGAGQDCAPDVGEIQSPQSPPPGDANCDGQADSLDAAIILQLWAGIIPVLPCQYAGDVNHNGSTGPIDAVLILQYDSGMLPAFS